LGDRALTAHKKDVKNGHEAYEDYGAKGRYCNDKKGVVMFTIGKFNFVQADSEDLKKAIYRLRYKVYVEEFGFEKAEDHPEGYEIDEYDSHSIHFAALNENQEVIGTIRMILHSGKGFPIERAAKISFIGERPAPDKIIEISRLAVSKDYRRRLVDGFFGVEFYLTKSTGGILPENTPLSEKHQRRKRPVIILGLYRSVYQKTKKTGITHWYMLTEKVLWYALKRFGWLFYQVGDPVNYHGKRIPYLGILKDIDTNLMREKPDLYKFYSKGLEKES
jgi:N-acyl amino acid synthase of PEP-CTERM/exosortase system